MKSIIASILLIAGLSLFGVGGYMVIYKDLVTGLWIIVPGLAVAGLSYWLLCEIDREHAEEAEAENKKILGLKGQ